MCGVRTGPQDKHHIGKPCLLKRRNDVAYVGHVRIDCEVVWSPLATASGAGAMSIKGGDKGTSTPRRRGLAARGALAPASTGSANSSASGAGAGGEERVELPPFPVDISLSQAPSANTTPSASPSPSPSSQTTPPATTA